MGNPDEFSSAADLAKHGLDCRYTRGNDGKTLGDIMTEKNLDTLIQRANELRRKAFLRREQAKNPKHPSEVGRLLNDAATMEQNAECLEQDAKRLWRS